MRDRVAELEQIVAENRYNELQAISTSYSLQMPLDLLISSVMSNLPGMAYRCKVDRDWTMEFVSEGCFELTGYQPDEILNNQIISYESLTHPDDRDYVRMSISECLKQNQPFRCCYRIVTANGEEKWVLERGSAVFSDRGEAISLTGLIIDVDEQKQAEKALEESKIQLNQQAQQLQQTLSELQQTQTQLVQTEKMSSLGQMVAGIAHEINNPVNFIHGNLIHAADYTHNLLDLLDIYQKHFPQIAPEIQHLIDEIDLEFLREDLPKLLTSMQTGTERIRGIVQSLRNFSRLDEAEVKSVDLHEGLDSTLLILANRLKPKPDRAEIKVIKAYGCLPLVECYAGQLNQVFMNILANSIDALEELTPDRVAARPSTISIETEVVDGWVTISIADNGSGMTETTRQRLFDPFYTTKAVGKGTGLGMSISYQIVTQKHQGFLECNSELGKGAEFMIKLPLINLTT